MGVQSTSVRHIAWSRSRSRSGTTDLIPRTGASSEHAHRRTRGCAEAGCIVLSVSRVGKIAWFKLFSSAKKGSSRVQLQLRHMRSGLASLADVLKVPVACACSHTTAIDLQMSAFSLHVYNRSVLLWSRLIILLCGDGNPILLLSRSRYSASCGVLELGRQPRHCF
jgi:hypothetical protein